MIYDGNLSDTTNFYSSEFLKINSCNTKENRKRSYTVIRNAGRVDYHILYVEKGECTCVYKGKSTILKHGDFVLYEPGVKHLYSYGEGVDTRTMWVHFTGRCVEEILENLSLGAGVGAVENPAEVERCFYSIINRSAVATSVSSICATGHLLRLLSMLSSAGTHSVSYPDAVSKMLAFINRSWQKELGVKEVASAAGLSESRASHLFCQFVGQSIHKYLIKLRLNHAKELLSDTTLAISQISDMVGYKDPLYFSRIFRQEVGASPKDFRLSLLTKR